MDTDAQLRKQLGELLRVDSDFDAFCYDCFPTVSRRYSSGMDRTTKTTLLLQVVGRPEKIRAELEKWRHRLNEPRQRYLSRSIAYITLLLIAATSTSSLIYQRTTQRSLPILPLEGSVNQPPSLDHAHDPQPHSLCTSATPRLLTPTPLFQNQPTAPVECFGKEGGRCTEFSRGVRAKSDKAITNIFTGNIATVIQNYQAH